MTGLSLPRKEAAKALTVPLGMLGHDDLQSMVLEVKGGKNVEIGIVYDMRVVLERETAQVAGLMNMDELGDMKVRDFVAEMARVGDLDVHCVQYARLQMVKVQDILDCAGFATPTLLC